MPHSPRPVDTPTARVAAAPRASRRTSSKNRSSTEPGILIVHDGHPVLQREPLATTDGTHAVYPVVSVDAIRVKFRDGQAANRPIHVALAVTCEGLQDVLQALAR